MKRKAGASTSRISLRGCIQNIKLFKNPLKNPEKVGVSSCFVNYTYGVFIGPNGGYGQYPARGGYKVGRTRTFKLKIRTRSENGLLLYVGGNGDYVIIELVDGKVVARAQNGGGEISVTLTPPYGVNLCIGKSVEILLKKEARKLTLTVDGHTPVTASRPGASSADTKSPIFFGGVPGSVKIKGGLKSKKPFIGCIVEFEIDNKKYGGQITSHGLAMKGCPLF